MNQKKQLIANKYQQDIIENQALVFKAPPELAPAVEQLAEFCHNGWLNEKMEQGYSYDPVRNDKKLKHPWIVPYHELPTEAQESCRANGIAILDILNQKGVKYVSFKNVLRPLVARIHDAWSKQKFLQGYVWGPETMVDPETGIKYHRDLLPIEQLWEDPELRADIKYDISTAWDIIIHMITEMDLFPIIPRQFFNS